VRTLGVETLTIEGKRFGVRGDRHRGLDDRAKPPEVGHRIERANLHGAEPLAHDEVLKTVLAVVHQRPGSEVAGHSVALRPGRQAVCRTVHACHHQHREEVSEVGVDPIPIGGRYAEVKVEAGGVARRVETERRPDRCTERTARCLGDPSSAGS